MCGKNSSAPMSTRVATRGSPSKSVLGKPCAGIEVILREATSSGPAVEEIAYTDPEGHYEIRGLPLGSYEITAYPETTKAKVLVRSAAPVDAVRLVIRK